MIDTLFHDFARRFGLVVRGSTLIAVAAWVSLLTSGCSRAPLRDSIDGARDAASDGGGAVVDRPPADAPAAVVPGDGAPPHNPRPLGGSCAASADCQSGFCAGGICCNAACEGPCLSCSSAGACTPLAAGTVCGAAGCHDDETYGAARTCDGVGACVGGATTACDPYSCDPTTNRCHDRCTSNEQCAGGRRCSGGICVVPGRQRCTTNGDCVNGFCADGVCCNVACSGPCVSCNLPGHQGTCWPVDEGAQDPHGVCLAQAPATCGTTGTCDGLGGCRQYPANTVCSAPRCDGDVLTPTGVCNGAGTCRAGPLVACVPYRCQGESCRTGCTTDDDCTTGASCVSGACQRPWRGWPCESDAVCASGFCAQGVCCDRACSFPCSSCSLPGTAGTCTPVANPDPSWGCPPAPRP